MRKALDVVNATAFSVLIAVVVLPLYLFFAAWGTLWLLWDVVRGKPVRWH